MIRVTHLVKEFRFYARPRHRVIEALTGGRLQRSRVFRALDDVSFEVPPGSSVGVVGVNGAGKSTLLRLVAGTLFPTSGHVETRGRVAALLELGTGFHPDFTGRQNILLNARFLGLGDDEIEERLPAIVEFAELGEFIDRPLRTYSSGMKMRLGFAVAANVSPDVLLVDESLSVGDARFQQKCIRRMREFRERGVTTLFVSHDFGAVRTLCQEAILLDGGRVVARGAPADVLEIYNARIASGHETREILAAEPGRSPRRSGSFAVALATIEICDVDGRPVRAVTPGTEVEIRLGLVFFAPVERPTVGVLVRDRLGNDVWGTNTFREGLDTGRFGPGETATVSFRLPLDLGSGEYTLTAAVHALDSHVDESYDWIDRVLVFRVLRDPAHPSVGPALLRPRIGIRRESIAADPAALLAELYGAPVEIDMSGPGLAGGWHDLEKDGEGAFRWTERDFAFVTTLAGRRLCLEVATDRPDRRDVRGELSLGHETLGSFTVTPGQGFSVIRFSLPNGSPPDGSDPRATRFTVRLDDAWCPKETSAGAGNDPRQLGIRVRRIWVES